MLTFARVVRGNTDPFGGIQLILCGDFLQLPPVTKDTKSRKFAFQSASWRRCVHTHLQLTEVRRQSDPRFINLLNQIRLGKCSKEVEDELSATSRQHIELQGILATRLCTHTEDVNQINDHKMKNLPGSSRVFEATDSGELAAPEGVWPVRRRLELRVGAQVMLAKNMDVSKGLVNGARGVVTAFTTDSAGLPIVRFLSGHEVELRDEKWLYRTAAGALLSRRQLPLKLAWAISIHKSQGMSLDCVEMSLSKVFECGQAYVALSRATSLQGLRVLDFDRSCVRADSAVLRFYERMERAHAHTESWREEEGELGKLEHW